MEAAESYLSSPEYGYDYVLAVSQGSLNTLAYTFLDAEQPVITVCYVSGADGQPARIGYDELKQRAGGIDPFAVPAAQPAHDAAVKALHGAGFRFGFQAAIGLPAGFDVATLPGIIALPTAPGGPVDYRLLCRTFVLVELTGSPPALAVFAQPDGGTAGAEPWVFQYGLSLVHVPVADVPAFLAAPVSSRLPAATRQRLAATPDAFAIDQLLFDFEHAASQVRPRISGVGPALRDRLDADFSIEYFLKMQAAGPPAITVVPRADSALANLQIEFSVNPTSTANPDLSCLNYLCATSDHPLPAPKTFAWDWMSQQDLDREIDGICVASRTQLVAQLTSQLTDYVAGNKWVPDPVIVEVYFTSYLADFGLVPRNHQWSPAPPDNLKIVTETFEAFTDGEVLLHWAFEAEREYDYLSGTSWMRGVTSFELTASVAGNSLKIEQHAVVHLDLIMVSFNRHHWDLVDLALTDLYELHVTADGMVTASLQSSTPTDHSATVDDYSWVVPDLVDRFQTIQKFVKDKVSSHLIDVPVSFVNGVVFPGGQAFQFTDVAISEHQDLIAHITYGALN